VNVLPTPGSPLALLAERIRIRTSLKNLLEEDVQSSALSFNKIIEVYVSVAGQTSVSNSEDYFFLVVGDLQAVK
jgi:hypothetical protein